MALKTDRLVLNWSLVSDFEKQETLIQNLSYHHILKNVPYFNFAHLTWMAHSGSSESRAICVPENRVTVEQTQAHGTPAAAVCVCLCVCVCVSKVTADFVSVIGNHVAFDWPAE